MWLCVGLLLAISAPFADAQINPGSISGEWNSLLLTEVTNNCTRVVNGGSPDKLLPSSGFVGTTITVAASSIAGQSSITFSGSGFSPGMGTLSGTTLEVSAPFTNIAGCTGTHTFRMTNIVESPAMASAESIIELTSCANAIQFATTYNIPCTDRSTAAAFFGPSQTSDDYDISARIGNFEVKCTVRTAGDSQAAPNVSVTLEKAKKGSDNFVTVRTSTTNSKGIAKIKQKKLTKGSRYRCVVAGQTSNPVTVKK